MNKKTAFFLGSILLGVASCELPDTNECSPVTDNFTSTYGPTDVRTHTFRVGCAGNISLAWSCPLCPAPDDGRLSLVDPNGSVTFDLLGAGFGGKTRSLTTALEGIWTLTLQGTGQPGINNYSVDVTYPSN